MNLLKELYGQVIIPQAVYNEIVVAGAGQAGATEVETFDWIFVQQVSNQQMVTTLQVDVDVGEAEAIVLAVELKPDLLLLDERKGRYIKYVLNLSK